MLELHIWGMLIMTAFLKVDNLHTGYGKFEVLKNINLVVNHGEAVAIIGANGAGKSTLLKCISGLIKCWSGSIIFNGQNISNLESFRIVDSGLIQIPEGRELFVDLTVEDNLLLGASRPQSFGKRHINLKYVYELFPILSDRKKQFCGTLSGGEQQMCAIGRALMSMPQLLMLDEPSLGLSPIIVKQLFKVILSINQKGCAILLVEQNVNYALRITDRAYIIDQGNVQLDGYSKKLITDSRVIDSYFGVGSKIDI